MLPIGTEAGFSSGRLAQKGQVGNDWGYLLEMVHGQWEVLQGQQNLLQERNVVGRLGVRQPVVKKLVAADINEPAGGREPSGKPFLGFESHQARSHAQRGRASLLPVQLPPPHLLDQHFRGAGLQDDVQVRAPTHHLSCFLHQTGRECKVRHRTEPLLSVSSVLKCQNHGLSRPG